jgi:hypothetical protein
MGLDGHAHEANQARSLTFPGSGAISPPLLIHDVK